MVMFLGTFDHKIDQKRRLSVPVEFRARLGEEGAVFVFESLNAQCLEVRDENYFVRKVAPFLDRGDLTQDERDYASALFSETYEIAYDKEGRMRIPEKLFGRVGIHDSVSFVGMGAFFEIWAPDIYNGNYKVSRKQVQEKDLIEKMRHVLAGKPVHPGSDEPDTDSSFQIGGGSTGDSGGRGA